MSKRKRALASMELESPPLSLVGQHAGRRPGQLRLDRMQPNPDQPRKSVDVTTILQLAADIRSRGLMQPIVVGPPDARDMYSIVAGERRWRACQKADLMVAEVVIDYGLAEPDAMFDAALAENIQREDLSRPELAAALLRVKQRTGAVDELLAEHLSKSIEWVRQVLAFGALATAAQRVMEDKRIPIAVAKAVRELPEDEQTQVLRHVGALESREEQLATVGQIKDILREGRTMEDALNATTDQPLLPVRRPTANPALHPFEWAPNEWLRVNRRALAQVRGLPARNAAFEDWLTVLEDDLRAARLECERMPPGQSLLKSLRTAVALALVDTGEPT